MSQGLANILKKKLKKSLDKQDSLNSGEKTLSWCEYHEYDDTKSKKPFRSTPYPKVKKIKTNNTTCKTLSFDDSDSEDSTKENGNLSLEFGQSKSQGMKRKRSSGNWEITSCDVIKPDKSNRQCLENHSSYTKDSSLETLVSDILENDSTSDDESISSEAEAEQIYNIFLPNTNKCHIMDLSDTFMLNNSNNMIEENDTSFNQEISSIEKIQNNDKTPCNQDIISVEKVENNNKKPSNQETTCIENVENEDKKTPNEEITWIEKVEYNDNISPNQEITSKEQHNNEKIVPKKLKFGKLVRLFMGENFVILFLKHPLKLYFNGKLSVTVLFGSIEILGSVLDNKYRNSVDVYSPRGHAFLCLETLEHNLKTKESFQKILTPYNIPSKQLKAFLYYLKENDSVVLVRNINNKLTNYMSLHVSQYLYPKPMHCEKTIEHKLHCLFEVEEDSWKVFHKDELQKCCDTLNDNILKNNRPSSILLCGGKSVGKSTLFRYMTNYFLNKIEKVVCIDLDPGQCEFTVPGCISVSIIDKPLLGPNFSHLQTPVKSFFVGDVNVMNCIDRYILSVRELIEFCEKNVTKEYPWIVNYMGFSKSLGCDLAVAITKIVRPTELVQISSSVRSRNYYMALTKENIENYVYSFPIITPVTKVNYNYVTFISAAEEKVEGDFQFEARHLREMSIISYFSEIIEEGKEITSLSPYSVKLSSIKLHDLNYSKENILAVMNGNLVALCNTKNNIFNSETVFECYGFGIIRGIDKHTQELYLLTPVKEENLVNINSLIRGNINLPPSLYMSRGRQGLVPYILLGNQLGKNRIPKRSFMNLKTLLKKK